MAEIDFVLDNGYEKTKEKLSQPSVSQEEVVGTINSTFNNILDKLSQDDVKLGTDEPEFEKMDGFIHDTDEDLSISHLERDLHTWMSEDDVFQQEIEVDWKEDQYINLMNRKRLQSCMLS